MKKLLLIIILFTIFITGLTMYISLSLPKQNIKEEIAENDEDEIFVISGSAKPYRHYFDHLTKKQQEIYTTIFEGLTYLEDNVAFEATTEDDASAIMEALFRDNPIFFYIDNRSYLITDEEVVGYQFDSIINGDKQFIKAQIQEVEKAADEIIANIPKNSSTYDVVRYFFETILKNTTYKESIPISNNLYDALVKHETQCGGYSKAFKYLCDKVGIPCLYVTGYTLTDDETGYHAWNEVLINDKWYWVDCTWGEHKFYNYDLQQYVYSDDDFNYNYFLYSDLELFRQRIIQEVGHDLIVTYPEASDTSLEHCALNGCMFDTYDFDTVNAYISEKVNNKQKKIELKFSDVTAFNEAVDDLINYKNNQLNNILYYATDKPQLLRYSKDVNRYMLLITVQMTYIEEENNTELSS